MALGDRTGMVSVNHHLAEEAPPGVEGNLFQGHPGAADKE